MRKVGIMSMQRIANYGSFLQAYACKEKEFEGICNWWYPKMCRPIRGLLTL